jgi:hypothetical protein
MYTLVVHIVIASAHSNSAALSPAAFIHILHFMVLFMIIHITFSMIGYLNFGPQNRDFSTIGNAMMVLGEGVLSGHFDVGPVFGNGLIAYGEDI